MKLFLYFFPVLFINFCYAKQSNVHHYKKHDEQWALSKIRALPEVKDFMHYEKKYEPELMIARDPDSTNKFYCVKLGISNFNMFRTSDDFDVDPKTSQIYYEQVYLWLEHGSHRATLKQWRRWRH